MGLTYSNKLIKYNHMKKTISIEAKMSSEDTNKTEFVIRFIEFGGTINGIKQPEEMGMAKHIITMSEIKPGIKTLITDWLVGDGKKVEAYCKAYNDYWDD